MKIYVKYCGGCNPRYDRAEFVRRLGERLDDGSRKEAHAGYDFQEQYDDPDVSLIVCGCASACADKSDVAAPYGVFTVWNSDSIDTIADCIRSIGSH